MKEYGFIVEQVVAAAEAQLALVAIMIDASARRLYSAKSQAAMGASK